MSHVHIAAPSVPVAIKQEGARVVLSVGGRRVLDIPWDQMARIARVALQASKKAEEIAKVDRIITDAAILARAGASIGLSSHPKIRAEAKKTAEWDLRRYMPKIPTREVAYGPAIIQHKPTPAQLRKRKREKETKP